MRSAGIESLPINTINCVSSASLVLRLHLDSIETFRSRQGRWTDHVKRARALRVHAIAGAGPNRGSF